MASSRALGEPRPPLSDLDRQLIALLQADGRMPYREIARRLGCSEKTVRTRVHALLDKKTIEITAITPPRLISHSGLASIGIRVLPSASITGTAARLAELARIDYVAIGAGRFHIYAEAICRDKAELLECLEEDVNGLEGIQDFEVFPYIELFYQEGLASPSTDDSSMEWDPDALDPLDVRILEHLTVDGRMAFRAIAKELDVSEALVRQRVNALRERGAVRISAITNPMSLGLTTAAWIGMNVAPGHEVRKVAAGLAAISAVTYIALCSGRTDMFFEVLCRDDGQFLKVMDAVRMVPGVAALETFMYLDLHYERPRFVLQQG
jgi:DNA-binding Lrp family transcriptional regulator